MANNNFIQVTIEIFGSIIMAVVAMIFVIITGNKKKSEKNLFVILVAAGFSLLMAACWYLCEGVETSLAVVLNRLCNLSVFICNPIMCICISRYVYNLIEESGGRTSKPWRITVTAIAIAAFIIPISNIFYKWMYYFDSQNNYHRLDGWYIYTVINSLGMLVCIISVIAQRKHIMRSRSIALFVFFVVQGIGILLQSFIIGIPLVQIGTAFGSLWVIASYLIEWIQKEKNDASEDKQKMWLIECVFSIMILFISAAIITCAVSVNDVSNENSEQNSKALAYMVTATIDSTISEPLNVSRTMAQSEVIREFMAISDPLDGDATDDVKDKEAKMLEFMKRIKDEYGYQTVFIATEKTRSYYTYDGFSRYMDAASGDAWYEEFLNEGVQYELNIDADKNKNMELAVFINMLVKDDDGNVLGVCGVAMSLESMLDILNNYQENYNLEILLTDSIGLIQISTDRDKIESEAVAIPYMEEDIKHSDELHYERKGNVAVLTKYITDYEWYLIIRDHSPDKLNVFRIILPSMVIYVLGVIIMMAFSMAFSRLEKHRSNVIRATKLQSEMAKAASEAKGRFLANVSHEIRTPLNAVLGMDTMILRESKDEKIKEYAMSIRDSGNILLSLINDILDISKIESGKMEIIPVEYDFATLIYDVLNMTTAKAESKGLELKLAIDNNLPSALYGDDVRIRQILLNIINNAIKYTEKGSVTLIVDGEIVEDHVILSVCVKDTGIGIKEEDIKKLFDDYVRVDEERNKNIEGTGLGISITVQLLELMNSGLEVASVYGEGSEFSFKLEQKIINYKSIGDIEYNFHQKAENFNYESLFIAPEAKILVVDDNDINRMVFINLLKETKVQIDEANSGIAALDLVFAKAYDIIFLDHMMPDMDGIEVMHKIKENNSHPNINTPIIVLTANAISGVKEQYMLEGFNDYLSKPIIPEQLERMMFSYLPEDKKKTGELAITIDGETPADKMPEVELPVELPVIEGVDWNYAKLHFPKEDALLATLGNFVGSMDSEKEYIEKLYGVVISNLANEESPEMTDALDAYRIRIHSLKSNATLLGIVPVAGMALMLEKAAREKLINLVKDMTPYFITMWDEYKDRLSFVITDEETKQTIEDYSLIKDYIIQLKEAIGVFDVRGADSVLAKLKEYSYDSDTQKVIDDISVAVNKLDTDRVTELCDVLLKIFSNM